MKQTFRLIVICVILSALIFGAPGPVGAAPIADSLQAQKASPKELLNADSTLNLNGAFHGALDLDGWNVQIDPARGPIFAPASQPAPGQWASVGVGANGSITGNVFVIVVSGTDVYLGGSFTNVAGPAGDYIIKWNGTNWSALGSGSAGDGSLNDYVYTIAVSGTNVYAGGEFRDVNNNGTVLTAADFIAKWDGTNWSALGSDGAGNGSFLNGSHIYDIAISGTKVYVGGLFRNVNNNGMVLTAADHIVKWDALTSNWSALGSNGIGNGSLNGYVSDITISGANLYVGGGFININNNGTVLKAADYIAKWNGTSWSALGSNGAGDGSLNRQVVTIVVSGTDVYVGGFFTNVNDKGIVLNAADYIVKWNGTSWSALGSNGAGDGAINANGALYPGVYAIAVNGSDVYVGGVFTNINNNGKVLNAADYIAKWNVQTGNWSALGANGVGNGSLNSYVSSIVFSGTDIYVGGSFRDVSKKDGTILAVADYIAKWNGTGWLAVGSDFTNGSVTSTVYAVAVSGTDVYVGGLFRNVNNHGVGVPEADYIAKWSAQTGNWSALGSNGAGDGSLNSYPYAIAVSGTSVYVGGRFKDVNNNGTVLPAADFIAKWDMLTGNWSALGSNGAGNGSIGPTSSVFAITVSGAIVYVGGDFKNLNNNGTVLTAADNIAKWNGTRWLALGSNGAGDGSIQNRVRAVAVSGANVYVGGEFTDVNNNGTVLNAADYIVKWNGSSWSALGSNGAGDGSLNKDVRAIALSGTDVYVGGRFTDVNNSGTVLTAADKIAKWNGASWSALGSNGAGNGSLNFDVYTIAINGTDVYAGGTFIDTNNNGPVLTAADKIAKWNGTSWSALGSNGAGDGSLKPTVYSIKVSGSTLYVGGIFTDINNNGTILRAADYIAAYGLDATPTPTPTYTVTPTQTVGASQTMTATQTPTVTATPSLSPSPTMTMTTTPTSTETETPTPSPSPTETVTPTQTVGASPTQTVGASPTQTVTATP